MKNEVPENPLAAVFTQEKDGHLVCWCGDYRIHWHAHRIHETEHRLNHLEGRYGSKPFVLVTREPEGQKNWKKELERLILAGQKVDAIKWLRQHRSRLGLKEAYEYVNKLEAKLKYLKAE